MKKTLYLTLILTLLGCAKQQSKFYDYPISAIDIKDVTINDNFWLPKIKVIQNTTIKYAFDKCDKEGRMENFLIAGGVKSGQVRGKMPFDDTDIYKIIEGASYSLISEPNPILDAYLDSIIAIIKIGQEPDGYLTTWFTIDPANPPAFWVKPSTSRWENEISSHELYNSGHLFEAAAAHYLATGKKNFLDIALKNADLLVANFGPGKLHCPPGHQIIETGLIKLYQITGKQNYLELAKLFLDLRGDSAMHTLYGAYSQDHLPVTAQTEAVGHAVRAVYMYAGMTDIAAIYNDLDYRQAVFKIWENIVSTKMYLTGGLGARHEGEAFGENFELPNLTAYCETCAAIGSVYWNHRLFLLAGDSKYYDVIERTLYNGLISGISLDGKNFFYPNPLESDGKYTRQPWFDCSCCPTNLIRFIPSVPGLIYAANRDSLYINLFIANKSQALINGKKVELVQQTDYPWKGQVMVVVNPDKRMVFTVKIRIPGWAQNKPVPSNLYSYLGNHSGKIILKVNGIDRKVDIDKGYVAITRKWAKGDKIELMLPMVIQKVVADERVQDDNNKIAFESGPIVYCAEEVDNDQISEILISDNLTLKEEGVAILSDKVNVLKGNAFCKELTLIPYYLWSNRGIGKMKVWFPRKNE